MPSRANRFFLPFTSRPCWRARRAVRSPKFSTATSLTSGSRWRSGRNCWSRCSIRRFFWSWSPCLIVFLVTYVVPNFASLYSSMEAKLPAATRILIAVGTTARSYVLFGFAVLLLLIGAVFVWSRRPSSQETLDRVKMRLPLVGEVWTKYQVAQLSRVLGTLLVGGIPLVQGLETAGPIAGKPAAEEGARSDRGSGSRGEAAFVVSGLERNHASFGS